MRILPFRSFSLQLIQAKHYLFLGAVLMTLFCWGGQTILADTVIGNIPVGTGPSAVEVNPVTNKIYVVNEFSNNVTVIDGTNNTTTTVTVGTNPSAVAINSVTNKIYVTNRNSNNVTVIDGANNTTTTIPVGTNPQAIAVNSMTNKIYVTNRNTNNVTVIDGTNNTTATISVGNSPIDVAINPVTNKIYVANSSSRNVTVIDGTNNSTVTVMAGVIPSNVAVNQITNKIYVANGGVFDIGFPASITVIDGTNNSTVTLSMGLSLLQPGGLAVNPVTNKFYVGNLNTANVLVFDGTTNTFSIIQTAGFSKRSIKVNQVTNKIYVADYFTFSNNNNNLTVINGTDNSTAQLEAGRGPVAIAINQTTNKIYVANQLSNNVTVIDGTDNSMSNCTPLVVTTSEGDLFPGGLASFVVTNTPNSITVDSIDSGSGLQSLTVVNSFNTTTNIPAFTFGTFNPVTTTFTRNDPNVGANFTLRAANQFHAIFINVQCHQGGPSH